MREQHTSDRAKCYSFFSKQNLAERFIEQARKYQDLEYGRASLPTVQALIFLFINMAYLGRDRAGYMYKAAALEMLYRLRLDRRFARLHDEIPEEHKEKRAISRMLWGMQISDG